MKSIYRWKSGAVAMMAMAITTGTVAPIFVLSPANAQYSIGQPRNGVNNSRDITISRGARIPTKYNKEKIYLVPGETMKVTLVVSQNLVDGNGGNILIPRDSKIKGEFVPVKRRDSWNSRDSRDSKDVQGTQFIAREIVLPNGETQRIDASSDIITRTEKVKKGPQTGEILRDAGYGAAAGAVIGLLTGDKKVGAGELLIGGAAGSIYRVIKGGKEANLIAIYTDRDLNLRLDSPLTISMNRNKDYYYNSNNYGY
ncbi:conjugal transfer protein TrbI [Brunnivagina elsteri]|uniref:Conjugal transfer protein TrbI n=1 Tax=Brunnivagina elsteri CCALA 953 TaxID=987040 RepID=A0A2A2TBP8_9CYAN|nr:conjugal transfer protein TrbI [Calothrix elsteri]PAX51078.1 conjugal transfer protein TrbI [Calothrix elsteri CCALA 953]